MTEKQDLVQPGGVNGEMDHMSVGIGVAEPGCRCPVTVRGSVVHNPEDPPCRGVRLSAHDLFTRPVNGFIPVEDSHRPMTCARWTS